MVWYENLYVGSLAGARKDQLIGEIDKGNYPPGSWILAVSDNPARQLEMYSASELKHDFVKDHCLLIVGLAFSRAEAEALLLRLVEDVYRDRGDTDIRSWLSVEHSAH